MTTTTSTCTTTTKSRHFKPAILVFSDFAKKVRWNKSTTSGNWTAVKPAVDLEATPLEIKTNSAQGSTDKVAVYFYNSQGDEAGGVWIYFSTPQYGLTNLCCSSWTNFPRTLPTAVDKVWRISLTRTAGIRLQIHCNDVEVLNLILSNERCNSYNWRYNWRYYWTRDVEKIGFSQHDTASDFYRPYQQGESIYKFQNKLIKSGSSGEG